MIQGNRYTYVCTFARARAHTHTRTQKCVCVCVCVCVRACVYTHTTHMVYTQYYNIKQKNLYIKLILFYENVHRSIYDLKVFYEITL